MSDTWHEGQKIARCPAEDCDRTVRLSPTRSSGDPVMCGSCGKVFRPEVDGDD